METTTIISYTGQGLSEFCGNFGYSRITGESDWSLRKRFFVKTFSLTPELAVEILFGTKTKPKDFIGADQMMYLSLFAGANHNELFTEVELQKYVDGFNVDPLILREGLPQLSTKAVESVDYKTLSKNEFRKRLIAIITSSNSKREIKNRICNELQYGLPHSFSIYYGTMNSSKAIISRSGVKVVTTLLYHPEGNFALGWD